MALLPGAGLGQTPIAQTRSAHQLGPHRNRGCVLHRELTAELSEWVTAGEIPQGHKACASMWRSEVDDNGHPPLVYIIH